VSAFRKNQCKDDRITNLDSASVDYQNLCQSLAYDFAQVFMPYKCNNWFCNNHGNCQLDSSSVDNAKVTCQCAEGWAGSNCMYTEKDQIYALAWVQGTDSWVRSLNVTDEKTFLALVKIAKYIINFSGTVSESYRVGMEKAVSNIVNKILNAQVTNTDAVSKAIQGLTIDILSGSAGLAGVDITQIISAYGNATVNTTDFGFTSAASNPKADVTLQIGSNRRVLVAQLYNRFLQTVNSKLNIASPKAVIPKDVSASLPTNARFDLTFIRNPKAYNRPAPATYINSQIVSLTARGTGNTTYLFPNGATAVTINVPWAYVPFKVNETYSHHCTVNKWENNTWIKSGCVIDSASNVYGAVVLCNEFSTIGISCKNAKVDTAIFISNPAQKVNETAKNASSFITFSSFIIALIGLVLF
jgi:hypothetical protein